MSVHKGQRVKIGKLFALLIYMHINQSKVKVNPRTATVSETVQIEGVLE